MSYKERERRTKRSWHLRTPRPFRPASTYYTYPSQRRRKVEGKPHYSAGPNGIASPPPLRALKNGNFSPLICLNPIGGRGGVGVQLRLQLQLLPPVLLLLGTTAHFLRGKKMRREIIRGVFVVVSFRIATILTRRRRRRSPFSSPGNNR